MTRPCWRVWTYATPAIVLGCSQRALSARLEPAATRPGGTALPVLVRESGGGAVLTGPWLVAVSLVLPHGHPWLGANLLQSYEPLGRLHVAALSELGIAASALAPAQVAGAQAALAASGPRTPDWACFGSLSPWEVVDVQGRKLVGLAQRRRQSGVLLVAGTLVAPPEWRLLCEALGQPQDAAALRQRTVDCAQLLGRALAPAAWAGILERRLAQALG